MSKPTMDLDFLITEMSLSNDYLVVRRVPSDGSGEPKFEVDSLDFGVEDALWGAFTSTSDTVVGALEEYHRAFLERQQELSEPASEGDDE